MVNKQTMLPTDIVRMKGYLKKCVTKVDRRVEKKKTTYPKAKEMAQLFSRVRMRGIAVNKYQQCYMASHPAVWANTMRQTIQIAIIGKITLFSLG